MITIDIETKSDKDIAKCGVYAYADSPYFDILLFAYSVDGQPVQVVDTANGEEIQNICVRIIRSIFRVTALLKILSEIIWTRKAGTVP